MNSRSRKLAQDLVTCGLSCSRIWHMGNFMMQGNMTILQICIHFLVPSYLDRTLQTRVFAFGPARYGKER